MNKAKSDKTNEELKKLGYILNMAGDWFKIVENNAIFINNETREITLEEQYKKRKY